MSVLNFQVIKRNPTIYDQMDIFGGVVTKTDSKVILVIKRKKDGLYLSKKWWKKEKKYTSIIENACWYKKRNYFPHNDKEIKRIIKYVIRKRIITEKEWEDFINTHIFEQVLI